MHHQVGNFQTTVDRQEASVRCYGVAFHHRSGVTTALATRIFVGTYELRLTHASGGWRIQQLKFKLKFIDGNRELEKAVRAVESSVVTGM